MAGDLYRRLARLLRDAGCEPVRQAKGSHEIWCSPLTNRTFSVPANISSRPLANAILKQAGLDEILCGRPLAA
jgi:predicted RNA binding protein YcfA (HicA-like mRNA interferase family)